MKIHFLVPPPAHRVGGLDAALDSARAALEGAGCPVRDGLPDPGEEAEAVVHFHGLWQPSFPPLARECRARGIPYVVSPHGMLEPWAWRHKWWKKWPYFLLRERGFLQQATALVATAEPEAENLRHRLPEQQVAVLPLGLTGEAALAYTPARQALVWAEEERVLLYLSRIHPKKGLHLLLAALAKQPVAGGLRLVIVGEGEAGYVEQLRQLAAKLPTSIRVDWVGPVWGDARWPYFQGADLFCLPTHSENFGLAVLEALQVGTPVLTTHATPWAKVVPELHGYITHPETESVAEALGRFLGASRPGAGERDAIARWTEAHFAWRQLLPTYRAFYAGLLK